MCVCVCVCVCVCMCVCVCGQGGGGQEGHMCEMKVIMCAVITLAQVQHLSCTASGNSSDSLMPRVTSSSLHCRRHTAKTIAWCNVC